MTPALDKLAPVTRQLASLASVAARVDRTILRRLRLELLDGDATVESDLWFSNIVAMRSRDEITLATEYLDELRELLVASHKLDAARRIVKAVHRSAAPLLALEEELIELGLTNAPRDAIQARLGAALATIREQTERAADVSDWALSALPRLPASVRSTAAAWSLAIAAETRLGFSVDLGEQTATDELVLDPNVAMTSLRVQRTREALVLGASLGADLPVPATTPRIVRVNLGSESMTVSVPAGEAKRIPLDGDRPIVITSLKGERWQVRTEAADGVAPLTSIENGRWILVDGTPALDLPPDEHQLALALGRALADHGFSLITLGRRGVSHVVARSFMAALAPRGFTSGIYPLLHIIEAGTHADFGECGRELFPPRGLSAVIDAVDHADAVIAIGDVISGLRDATSRPQQLTYRELSAPAPVDNPTRIAERAVERLLEELRPVAPTPPGAAAVVQLAAAALDQRDLAAFGRASQRVARDAIGLHLDSSTLLIDPRPSHRLVGYQLRQTLPLERALAALLLERTTVRAFWETRTLSFALQAVQSYSLSQSDASAIAAACASIELELEEGEHIDPGAEIKSLLGGILGRMPASKRARGLAEAAVRYEELRDKLPGGDERTRSMTAIVEEVCARYRGATAREVDVWFSSGRAGQRIVALALLLASGDPAGCEQVEAAIVNSRSPFEQYTALRVVREMMSRLQPAQAVRLRLAIEQERQSGGSITQDDLSRWSLSASLMEALSRHTTGRRAPSAEASPAVSKADIGIVTIREDEFEAVLGVFPDSAGIYQETSLPYVLRHANAGHGRRYRVAVLRAAEQGNARTQDAARRLIEDLAPKLVLVVGIAGGFPSDDLTLGDVVVSTRLMEFDAHNPGDASAYELSGGPTLAAHVAHLAALEDELGDWTADLPPPPPVTWDQDGQLIGPSDWQRELRDKLEHHHPAGSTPRPPRPPRYVTGPIATSDRLLRDLEQLILWSHATRNLLAFDMESGGVYRAVRERCPMLAIRGISDIVGLKRAEAWTKFACASAAAFARAFLRTRPVEPSSAVAAGPYPA